MRFVVGLMMLVLLLAASPLAAQEPTPRWIRYPAISPDGNSIAFSYRGQIYRVDATGGHAEALTSRGAYAHQPVWSPDSKRLAFATDINGDDDVYLADLATGALQRLTWSSRPEVPTSFSPDGKRVLFTATRLGDPDASVQAPLTQVPQLYEIELASGRERLVLPNLAQQAVWNRDETRLLYLYNPSVDPGARQHRVASNARQIWAFDKQASTYVPLVAAGTDALNPQWSADETAIDYLGEGSGVLNVWSRDMATGRDTQVTHFAEWPVRYLSVAADGTMAFTHNGTLYRLPAGATEPVEVPLTITEQLVDETERNVVSETTEFISSPDGDHFAAIVNSDVYLLTTDGSVRQVTRTPGLERDLAFSADGSRLAYAAQRDHLWGIYSVELDLETSGNGLAVGYEEIPLAVGGGNRLGPKYSPDGSKLAFIGDRREVDVLDLESGTVTSLFKPADYNTSYEDGDLWFAWSPTSADLLVQWRLVPGSVAMAGIVAADGSSPIRQVSRSVTDLSDGQWSNDGTQVIATTGMFGLRSIDNTPLQLDLYRVFLSDASRHAFLDNYAASEQQGEDAMPERYEFQQPRAGRLEGRLTDDGGDILAFFNRADDRSLAVITKGVPDFDDADPDDVKRIEVSGIDLKTGEVTALASIDVAGVEAMSYLPDLDRLDIKTHEGLTFAWLGLERTSKVPVSIPYSVDPEARRRATFEQAWADVKYKFYRADTEGRDWDRIGDNYRAFLDSVGTDRELGQLVEEMFGELGASHLFVIFDEPRLSASLPTDTGSLGVYLDYGYEGDGRRVAAILEGGPLDRGKLEIGAGDVIASIDGVPVPASGGLDRLLDGTAGRPVTLGVRDQEIPEERYVEVVPITQDEEWALNHQRWMDRRRDRVDQLSRGCVVYSYVPQMDNDAYVDIYGRLMASKSTALAALIDIRSNRGGNLTDQLMTLLTAKPEGLIGVENHPWETLPELLWTKPSAVLVDTYAYSDGSIFPQEYNDFRAGLLVGDSVLGTGTAVDYIKSTLLPGLTYGIPVLPLRRLDGSYFENREIVPDLIVPFDPNDAARGVDGQLDATVNGLLARLPANSDCDATETTSSNAVGAAATTSVRPETKNPAFAGLS